MKKYFENQISKVHSQRKPFPTEKSSKQEIAAFLDGESKALKFCEDVEHSGDSAGADSLELISQIGGKPQCDKIIEFLKKCI